MIAALIVGAAGLATFLLGVALEPSQAYFSYLVAYVFALGIVVNAVILIMIGQLIAASWFVVLRRIVEDLASALPVFVLLFVPIVFGMHRLFPWTNPGALDQHARELVERKLGYLNEPFFFVRAAIYFVAWIVMAELLRRWSLRQDEDPGERWSVRQRTLSGPGVIVMAFTLTFAAFDWLMSLDPTWYSTIWGVQVYAGGFTATLALLCVLAGRAHQQAPDESGLTPEHMSALGKMLFTFVIFWAYTTFAQLLIVWIADLPDEVHWYVPRVAGSWLGLGLVIIIGHFGIPFFTLLSYYLKRRADLLVKLGVWMLAMHYAETYWIVMPQFNRASARPHWTDASAAAMVVGFTVAFALWRARGHASVPIGDPELAGSLRYSET